MSGRRVTNRAAKGKPLKTHNTDHDIEVHKFLRSQEAQAPPKTTISSEEHTATDEIGSTEKDLRMYEEIADLQPMQLALKIDVAKSIRVLRKQRPTSDECQS